jgi:ribonuclease HI
MNEQMRKNGETNRVVHVYTDGASSGNPGPSGIGVLLRYGGHEKEVSTYIGIATNNKGHSGDVGNERVDGLATAAIAREKRSN